MLDGVAAARLAEENLEACCQERREMVALALSRQRERPVVLVRFDGRLQLGREDLARDAPTGSSSTSRSIITAMHATAWIESRMTTVRTGRPIPAQSSIRLISIWAASYDQSSSRKATSLVRRCFTGLPPSIAG